MALDVLMLPGRLSANAAADETPRVNVAQFGDGYSQRSGDGMNAISQSFDGECPSLSPASAETLMVFFREHRATPFLWSLPLETQQRKWIAAKWRKTFVATNRRSVSFTLTEVFDL